MLSLLLTTCSGTTLAAHENYVGCDGGTCPPQPSLPGKALSPAAQPPSTETAAPSPVAQPPSTGEAPTPVAKPPSHLRVTPPSLTNHACNANSCSAGRKVKYYIQGSEYYV
ncbi:hypothetical protein BVRB_4g087860 [Beta vulgaris subsp. vulgaris]|nr:hypothetical protein BVRB_4g087860 [Beta vulgaris subsp. vulgaris]